MALIYDIVAMQELQGFVQGVYEAQASVNFIGDQVFPNRENVNGEINWKLTKGQLADEDSATFRAWDAEASIGNRAGLSHIMGELAPMSRKYRVNEEESIRLRALTTGNTKPLVDAIYNDAAKGARAISVRIERARWECMLTGKLVLAENGVFQTIDYGRNAAMSVTAAIPWTTVGSAVPVTNERAFIKAYRDLNGFDPAVVIMSADRIDNMLLNTEYRNLATSTNGGTPSILTIESLNIIRRSFGLPTIVVFDGLVRVGGVSTRLLPADKLIFLPPAGRSVGVTLFAATAEAVELAEAKQVSGDHAIGLTAVVDKTFDPVATWTKVSAVAMPVMANPDYVMVADVA